MYKPKVQIIFPDGNKIYQELEYEDGVIQPLNPSSKTIIESPTSSNESLNPQLRATIKEINSMELNL